MLAKLPGDPVDSDGKTKPVWRQPDDIGTHISRSDFCIYQTIIRYKLSKPAHQTN